MNQQFADQNQLKLVPQSAQDDSHIAELTLKTTHDQEATIESKAKFKKEYEKYIARARFPVTIEDIIFDICFVEHDGSKLLIHKLLCQKNYSLSRHLQK